MLIKPGWTTSSRGNRVVLSNKNMRKKLGIIVGMPLVGWLLMLTGCGQGGGSATGHSLEAGLVPGADVVFRLDFKSARQAPVYSTLKELQNDQKGPVPAADLSSLAKTIETKLGLKEEDIEHLILSADLDSIKMAVMGPDPNSMKSMQGMLSIQVAKPVTTAQLKQTILELAASEGGETNALKFTTETIGGTEVLALTPDSESDPHVHIAVHGGQTILVGLNRPSVTSAIERAGSKPATLDPAIAGVMDAIGANSQVKLSFVVPQVLRDTLAGMTKDSGSGPGAMLSGFKDFKSLSLGIHLSDGLTVNVSGDLGNADAANGLNGLVSMMKPQFKAALAEQTGKKPEEIPDNALTANTKQSVVNVTMLLTKDLISALHKK